MISNEVQYRATKAHAARFQEALRNQEAGSAAPHDKRRGLEIAAVRLSSATSKPSWRSAERSHRPSAR